MRLTMGLKFNVVLVSLGLLAVVASLLSVVSRQVSDQEKILWQQSARAGRASLSAIDEIIKSLSRNIGRYAEEERGRSFFVKDVEQQLLELNWQSYALQDGIQAPPKKRGGRYLFRSVSEGSLSDDARMRALVNALGDDVRQLIQSWRELRKVKAKMAGYWGRARENKRLEYILLQMENSFGRRADNVDGKTITETLSARQKEFLTKRLPRWIEELKKTDVVAAELLETLHGQILLLMTMSDPVLSQGLKGGDGEVVTIPEVLARTRMAYQNWVVHVDRQVRDFADAQRHVMTPIRDRLAQMHATVASLERERAVGVVQTEKFLSQGQRDSRYVLIGIGLLALGILVISLFWVRQWSGKAVEHIQAISRRCDQTVHATKAIAQGWQRHVFQVVEQVAALSCLSASLKKMSPSGAEDRPTIGREAELVGESRMLMEQGLRGMKNLKGATSDIVVTSAEMQQVVAAIGDALKGIEGLLSAASAVAVEGGSQGRSSVKEKIDRAAALVSRVKAAVRYAEKILEEQQGGIAQSVRLSSQVNQQFTQMGEIAHQMMVMIARLEEDDERQRECWVEVMQDMGRVVHSLQASAGEIKISRVLSGEVKDHVENLQELAADLSGTMGLARDTEPAFQRQGAKEVAGREAVGTLDDEEREKQRLRRAQVEQYFESFLRSRQLVAPVEETPV